MQEEAAAAAPIWEDHRVRVAREKRLRMRATLLTSVVEVCSRRGGLGPAVIDDVVRHAEVSRGTFYKYFESLEQAVDEVAVLFADEVAETLDEFCRGEREPEMPLALSYQLFLWRALRNPVWGGFVIHLGLLDAESKGIAHQLRANLRSAVESGFKVRSVDAATDMVVGSLVEALFRIMAGPVEADYITIMADMILRGLGVPPKAAENLVERAHQRLVEHGQNKNVGQPSPPGHLKAGITSQLEKRAKEGTAI